MHSSRLKIQICIPNLRIGGLERQAVTLSGALARSGHDVQLLCADANGELLPLVGPEVELRSLERKGRFLPGGLLRLAHAIGSFRPDIFCGFSNVGSFYGVALARRAGVPLVVAGVRTLLARYSLDTRISARLFLPRAHVVVVNSASLLAHYTSKWGSLRGRLELLPNAVDLDEFRPGDETERAEMSKELGLRPEAFVVGHVGRFVPEKAHDDMIRAAVLVERSQWLFVGDGPRRKAIEQMASDSGVRHRVSFLGARSDVPRLLRALDLFCLPSWFEGMPNALVEAMAAGLPAVGTDVPGIVDLITPGKNGWLVPARDPAAMAEAIDRAAASSALLMEYGRNARQRAVALHGPEAIASAFIEICRKHLENGAGPARGREREAGR